MVKERGCAKNLPSFEDLIFHEPNSGCWLWGGPINQQGYGRFERNKIRKLAHRISYEAYRGPIPDGLVIDHLCRVRCCVNPEHLEAVTSLENIQRGDMIKNHPNKRKTHCIEGHPLDEANTKIGTGGRRQCRICAKVKTRLAMRKSAALNGWAKKPRVAEMSADQLEKERKRDRDRYHKKKAALLLRD